jgi:hypothetical protein
MTKLEQLKIRLHNRARKYCYSCNNKAMWLTTINTINEYSKEELKELYLFAKVRFITIGVIDKDKFYKLNEKGELELL